MLLRLTLYYNKSVWEKAFDHDTAMQMILNGECGAFNPLLLECLTEAGSRLHAELGVASADGRHNYLTEAQQISEAMLHEKSLPVQDHPCTELSMLLPIDGELRWHHVSLCSLWSDELPSFCIGAVGQADPM